MIKNMNETEESKVYKIYNKETTRFSILRPKDAEYGFVRKLEGTKILLKKGQPELKLEFLESISPEEPACAIFSGTFMMYHPDLNTESKTMNEERYPKGRARIFRDGRCYGNWNPDSTDGNANMTDIRVECQSKRLANTMGLTWNKTISKGQKNDLTIAMKAIIRMIHAELNANTSTTANEALYEEATRQGIPVPYLRKPSSKDKKAKEDTVQHFFAPATPSQREQPDLHLFSFKSPTSWAEMNETSAADCASSMRNGVKLQTEPKKTPVELQPQPPSNVVSPPQPVPRPEPKEEPPKEITHSIRMVPAKQDTVLYASEGIRIIRFLHNADNWADSVEEIKNIIKTEYTPKMCSDQIDLLFGFYSSPRVIFDVLIALVEQKYNDRNLDSTPMSGGAKLCAMFAQKKEAHTISIAAR
jgi:hypothetical protein